MTQRERLQQQRRQWKRKERNAWRRYRAATDRGQELAAKGVERSDPRRVTVRRKRRVEIERFRHHRDQRRTLDRQLAALPITQIDKDGMRFLERNEGLRTEPYNDSQGHATIGIGHLIHRGPVTAADRRRYEDFDRADAYALFDRDLDKYEATVRSVTSKAKRPISQKQFNALVSLCFNIGQGGFSSSTVAKRIKAGASDASIAEAIMRWNRPAEIIGRRRREADLFRAG